MKTRCEEFWKGVRDTLPLVIGAVPFGIIYGTLSAGAGLSAWTAMGMSVFVFAGSAQFIAVGLAGAGTAWPMIVLTTFVVNFRHLLYTAVLLCHLKPLPRRWRLLLAFGLTDETFAVAAGRWRQSDDSPHRHWYQLGSTLCMYASWNLCTVLGLLFGGMLKDIEGLGLDFAMVATFVGMLIPYLNNRPTYIAVLVSGIGAIVFHGIPHKLGLIIASVLGMAAGMLTEKMLKNNDHVSVHK